MLQAEPYKFFHPFNGNRSDKLLKIRFRPKAAKIALIGECLLEFAIAKGCETVGRFFTASTAIPRTHLCPPVRRPILSQNDALKWNVCNIYKTDWRYECLARDGKGRVAEDVQLTDLQISE